MRDTLGGTQSATRASKGEDLKGEEGEDKEARTKVRKGWEALGDLSTRSRLCPVRNSAHKSGPYLSTIEKLAADTGVTPVSAAAPSSPSASRVLRSRFLELFGMLE